MLNCKPIHKTEVLQLHLHHQIKHLWLGKWKKRFHSVFTHEEQMGNLLIIGSCLAQSDQPSSYKIDDPDYTQGTWGNHKRFTQPGIAAKSVNFVRMLENGQALEVCPKTSSYKFWFCIAAGQLTKSDLKVESWALLVHCQGRVDLWSEGESGCPLIIYTYKQVTVENVASTCRNNDQMSWDLNKANKTLPWELIAIH